MINTTQNTTQRKTQNATQNNSKNNDATNSNTAISNESLLHTLLQQLHTQMQNQTCATNLASNLTAATPAYRLHQGALLPIDVNLDNLPDFADLIGIDAQQKQLTANTHAFLHNLPANHALLTGARGTGKSSLIKALLKHFYADGLRIIEFDKSEFDALLTFSHALAHTKKSNPALQACHFIGFCDDLTFTAQDDSFRKLKTLLDGTFTPSTLLIYATSNRRHLLPQWRADNQAVYHTGSAIGESGEINPREAMDESISLSDRFGLWLPFYPFTQMQYLDAVRQHLQVLNHVFDYTPDAWDWQANALRFAQSRGNRSGRQAAQFARLVHMGKRDF